MVYRRRRIIRKTKRYSRRTYRRRKMLRNLYTRKRAKPELKWIDNFYANQGVIGGAYYLASIHPANIAQGPGRGQRIGNYVRTISARLRVNVSINPDSTDNLACPTRVVVLSPHSLPAQSDLVTYLNGQNVNTFHDPRLVHIFHDRTYSLSNPSGSVSGLLGGNYHHIEIQKYIKFPRRVNFIEGATTYGADFGDTLWVVVFNLATGATAPALVTNIGTRMNYIDC